MEQLAASPNQDSHSEPDLLAEIGDTQLEIMGIKGTLNDLWKMCPLDENDPRITTAAKNDFVVKAANECGLEVKPEHEEVFNRVTNQYGLERKFTVTPAIKEAKFHETDTAKKEATRVDIAKNEQSAGQDEVAHIHSQIKQPLDSEPTRKLELEQQLQSLPEAEILKLAPEVAKGITDTPEITSDDPLQKIPVTSTINQLANAFRAMVSHQNHKESTRSTNQPAETTTELPEPTLDLHTSEYTETGAADYAPEQTILLPKIAQEEVENTQLTEAEHTIQTFDNFVTALHMIPELVLPAVAEMDKLNQYADQEPESLHFAVANRLESMETDQKIALAPLLINITESLQKLRDIENGDEFTAIYNAQLLEFRGLCSLLLEELDLDPNSEQLEVFISTLVNSGFAPQVSRAPTLLHNLENIATHEANFTAAALTGKLLDVELYLHKALGSFVLVCSRNTQQAPSFR